MEGLAAGMDTAGGLYEQKEYVVPELLLCSDAITVVKEAEKPFIKAA